MIYNPEELIMCEVCGGNGYFSDIIGYATHEMAMDAGDMSYEGSPIWGEIKCENCNGYGWLFGDDADD